jgi:signal transduction histidine kinase
MAHLIYKAIFVTLLLSMSCTGADRLIVGLSDLPPNASTAHDHQIPFSGAVLLEAAKRAGIQLEFRETKNGVAVNRALEQGWIDLSPAAVPTSERRARFYLSAPWWSDDLILLVRNDGPVTEAALAGKRIAVKMSMLAEMANKKFPNSLILPAGTEATADDAASKVCNREADAALMTHRDALVIGLSRPPSCADVHLSTIPVAETLDLVLMSRQDKARLVQRLRNTIENLAQDGTLARIATRYPNLSASSTIAMVERIRQSGRVRILWLTITSLLVISIGSCFFSWRLHILHQRLRADIEARKAVEHALRRSNEDLQAFAYTVSHDLQEPLRNMSLYSELLERKYAQLLDSNGLQFLQVIRTVAKRMSGMLTDLLQFSRAGQDSEVLRSLDATQCVQSALDTLRSRIDETAASVRVGPLPIVCGWEHQLTQVFQNLIENALKYRGPKPQVAIEIQAEDIGHMWKFSVTDNGIGMSMEHRDKIFQVFKRLHGRTEYSGNGIGLAIARRIIERHAGRIWVDWSEPGQGTRFCFTLPVCKPDRSASAA